MYGGGEQENINTEEIVPKLVHDLKVSPIENGKRKMILNNLNPIKFHEHLKLTDFGVDKTNINFSNVKMESDKFICVKETLKGLAQLAIVDLENPKSSNRRKLNEKSESAILNPAGTLIVLKAEGTLQIYNIETKSKIKSTNLTENVNFLKWKCNKSIGIVTQSSVYHWSIGDNFVPKKLFDIDSSLLGLHIINYKTDHKGKWHLLVSFHNKMDQVVGSMQLYSVEKNVSQIIEGHAGVFAKFKMERNSEISTLLCFASRNQEGGKLHIFEVGRAPNGNEPFPRKKVNIFFPPESSTDFPMAIQASSKYDILYLITKLGNMHLYDLESGECIYTKLISSEVIFLTVPHVKTGGIIGVNMKGEVLSVTINEEKIVSYILNELSNEYLALRVATRNNLSGAEEVFLKKFNNLFGDGKYIEAAKVACEAPKSQLRTLETIQRFKKIVTPAGQTAPLTQYFGTLLDFGQLNKLESLELIRPVLQQGKEKLVEKWLKEYKLECSEELGDFVKQFDSSLALSVFYRANIPVKVVQCMAESGRFIKIIPYAKKVDYNPDYIQLLRYLMKENPDEGIQFAKLMIGDNELKLKYEIKEIVEIFLEQNMIEKCAQVLIDLKIDIDTIDIHSNSNRDKNKRNGFLLPN